MAVGVRCEGRRVTKREIVIRCALPRDVGGVYELRASGYDEAMADPSFGDSVSLSRITRKQHGEWFSDIMKKVGEKRAIFLVAEKEGALLGICSVRSLDSFPSEASHIGVLDLRVKKDVRSMGIGTRLMKCALRKSKSVFEIIELAVLSMNKPAKRLYRRFGFRRWGVAPREVKRRGKYLDRDYMYLRL